MRLAGTMRSRESSTSWQNVGSRIRLAGHGKTRNTNPVASLAFLASGGYILLIPDHYFARGAAHVSITSTQAIVCKQLQPCLLIPTKQLMLVAEVLPAAAATTASILECDHRAEVFSAAPATASIREGGGRLPLPLLLLRRCASRCRSLLWSILPSRWGSAYPSLLFLRAVAVAVAAVDAVLDRLVRLGTRLLGSVREARSTALHAQCPAFYRSGPYTSVLFCFLGLTAVAMAVDVVVGRRGLRGRLVALLEGSAAWTYGIFGADEHCYDDKDNPNSSSCCAPVTASPSFSPARKCAKGCVVRTAWTDGRRTWHRRIILRRHTLQCSYCQHFLCFSNGFVILFCFFRPQVCEKRSSAV
ncbi:unnamed protein product [Rangifer tarandus platyrhynchus]|uniref:Uncharacterized protein n=1 Tax=Rangifer tarandus platyrhynchus TaxID=3082113 RepID=A0ABN8XMA6_RANTA|nr:unnamed protein product [Rangifer tarandus platyrhynchus]